MRCHLGVLAFYLLVGSLLVWWAGNLIISVAFALPVALHSVLAYGSYKRIEFSRKVSEFVFAMLILAFPVGTLLAMFLFLPATVWQSPDA
jgi:hypothetical protein